jgi:hypothetical protein
MKIQPNMLNIHIIPFQNENLYGRPLCGERYKKINKALGNSIGRLFGNNFSRAIQRAIVFPGQNHFAQAGRFPCEIEPSKIARHITAGYSGP